MREALTAHHHHHAPRPLPTQTHNRHPILLLSLPPPPIPPPLPRHPIPNPCYTVTGLVGRHPTGNTFPVAPPLGAATLTAGLPRLKAGHPHDVSNLLSLSKTWVPQTTQL